MKKKNMKKKNPKTDKLVKVQTKDQKKKQKTENHLNRGNNSKGKSIRVSSKNLKAKRRTPELELTWRDMTWKTLATDKLAKWRHRLSTHKVMGNRWTQWGRGRLIRHTHLSEDSAMDNKEWCQFLLMKHRPFLHQPRSHQTWFALCQWQLLANTLVSGQVLRSWKQRARAKHTTVKSLVIA